MAHLTDGTLRRMVDDPDVARAEQAHLDGCPDCQARYKTIASDAHTIATLLAVPAANVDVAEAFRRVSRAPTAQPRLGLRLPVFNRPVGRPLVLAFAAVIAAVGLLATAIAVTQDTWTPTSVTPVPVTVADMQSLSQLADYGTITWSKQPSVQVLADAADASAAAGGLKPPTVTSLPAGVSSNVTYVAMSQATAVFTFSADKASAAAAKTGKTLPPLPAGMDGAQLTVTVGPAVGEVFGDLKAQQSASGDATQTGLPQLVVGVSSAPTASSTQVSFRQMRDYLISIPGISSDLKAALKAIDDPKTTLPIPIPMAYTSSKTVDVHGTKGIALGDNTGVGAAVIWVQGGEVYAVAGSIKQSDAIDIANNLK